MDDLFVSKMKSFTFFLESFSFSQAIASWHHGSQEKQEKGEDSQDSFWPILSKSSKARQGKKLLEEVNDPI